MDMSDKKEKAPFFSAKNLKLLTSPFGQNNPVTVQILGICSALAVTAKLKPAFVMALSVIVVTGFSSMIISLIRKGIPDRIRIIVQLVVVARHSGRPGAKGFRLRCQQTAFGICRVDHYQLYHHGAYRGIRVGQ